MVSRLHAEESGSFRELVSRVSRGAEYSSTIRQSQLRSGGAKPCNTRFTVNSGHIETREE
jgi:hypothetical protein